MGILRVQGELIGSKGMKQALYFLRRECNATIQTPVKFGQDYMFQVEGEDIPIGNREFSIVIQEVVPKVIAISIC